MVTSIEERHPIRRSYGRSAVLVVFFLLSASCAFAIPTSPQVYVLASGSPQGVYFPLAQDIAGVAHKAGVEIRVLPSEGSKQNLAWLAEGRADLALAQSDVASDAYRGRGVFSRPLSGLRVIAPLYTEAVHVLIHKPLYIHRLEDLRGKRIAVGLAGSGTEANAIQLLAAAGLTLAEVEPRRLSLEEGMAALRRGQVDAAFVTSGAPSEAVRSVLADGSASLFEPDRDLLERLRTACPFFVNKNIEPSDYPGLTEQVTTAGIQALLVGRSNLPASTIYRLVRTLEASKKLAAKYSLTRGADSASDAGIPTFEPAQRFFAFQSLLRREKLLGGILLGALVLAFIVLRFQRGIWRLLRRAEFFRVGLYFSTLWIAGSIALYVTEHRVNDNYSSFWKSMWSGLITIYSLSSKEPLTLEGRVVGVIIFLLGLAGIVWLTERLASFYLEKKILPLLRGGFARMHKMKDHYVIVGWSEKGPGILNQLHSEDLDQNRLVVILAKEGQADHLESHGLIQVERGESASEDDLRRVHVQAAHAVIILAESAKSEADAKTILTILAVRKICSAPVPKKPVAVIAEIFDPQNVELATFAGRDESTALEIISSHKVGEGLLSHAAVHPGLSRVYGQLLAFSRGHSEIHRTRVPDAFVGNTFDALVTSAVEKRSAGTYVLPIAIQRGSEVHINPTPSSPRGKTADHGTQTWRLQKGDYLYAICDSPQDLKELYHPRPHSLLRRLVNAAAATLPKP